MAGYFSPRWGKKETDHLKTILYQYPVTGIVIEMQKWQKKLNLPIRSAAAIRRKVYLLGRDSQLQEDRLSKVQLAKILGVSTARVTTWIKAGLPYTQRYRNREVLVMVEDFEAWAKKNLIYLHSIEPFRLSYFLSDKLVAIIPQKSPFRHPIRCVDNQQVFDTIADAAKAIGVDKTTLTRAVKSNKPCKGYQWQLITKDATKL
jgi:hypothetical protein